VLGGSPVLRAASAASRVAAAEQELLAVRLRREYDRQGRLASSVGSEAAPGEIFDLEKLAGSQP
jgi:hypothetical protein